MADITFFIPIPPIQFETINKGIAPRTNRRPNCQILVEELKLELLSAGSTEITGRMRNVEEEKNRMFATFTKVLIIRHRCNLLL